MQVQVVETTKTLTDQYQSKLHIMIDVSRQDAACVQLIGENDISLDIHLLVSEGSAASILYTLLCYSRSQKCLYLGNSRIFVTRVDDKDSPFRVSSDSR